VNPKKNTAAFAASTSMRHAENSKCDQNPSKGMQVSIEKPWAFGKDGRASSPIFPFHSFLQQLTEGCTRSLAVRLFWQQFTEDCFGTLAIAVCLFFPRALFYHAFTTGNQGNDCRPLETLISHASAYSGVQPAICTHLVTLNLSLTSILEPTNAGVLAPRKTPLQNVFLGPGCRIKLYVSL